MSETTAAAEVKILTRNPLIPWKRLVEMNLNSMSFVRGVDTVTEKSPGNAFNVSSDTVTEKCPGNGFNGSLGSVPEYLCHKISEIGVTLDVSGCCYKYELTENSNDHLDRDSSMECSFGKEQNEMKIHSKEKHDKSICLKERMYTEENMEARPDGGHHTFVTNELDVKLLPEFKDGVNNLKGSGAQTIYNMAVCENELNFEQEVDSTGQTPYCYKNVLSLLDDQRKISNLNCLEFSAAEYDKNAATDDTIPDVSLVCDTKQTNGTECNTADVTLSRRTLHALQDEENTFDAYSEKNCSRFDDSGIITHTDGVPCSLNENTLRETDVDGDSDWDLSFDDGAFLELCPGDSAGTAVLATEKTDQLPNVFCSEGLRDVPLDSNLTELETNVTELETSQNETLKTAVDNVTLPENVAGRCLVEDRHESHLNRSARQTGHYCTDKEDCVQPGLLQNHQSRVLEMCEPYRHCCNDKEDYEHPSPQLNCQSRVQEICEPYRHCCNDKEDYEHPSPQLNCQSRVQDICEPYRHCYNDKEDYEHPSPQLNRQSRVQDICEPYRHCCNDKEDYEHPSPQLICQSTVHENCQPYVHSYTSDEIKGGLTSPISERNKENYHGLEECDERISSDDDSETVRTISLVEHHGPDFVIGNEIKHHYDSELENGSQDVAVHLRGMPDLKTRINNEMINADVTLECSCDNVVSEKFNHENMEKFLTKNVCVVDAGAFEYNQKNPAVLSYAECFGSDIISTMKKCRTSTKSITTDEREIKVCCLRDIGSKWGREECRDENFLGNMENDDLDESLVNTVDYGNTDENIACNLEYGNFEVGDRNVCDELDMNSATSPHDSHSQMNSATSSHESHSQMNSATSPHESHSQMNSATSPHESHSQMNSATSPHESHSQMNSATSPHESHSQFGWQFDKLKTHELSLQNANLKRLTRDPLTCWKRLVDINIESMLSAKQQCVEGAVRSNGEEAKQVVKYSTALNKPESNVQTDSASHLENVCSCDKYKLLEDMDVNYYDMDSSIFNVICGGLASSELKIDRGVIREGEGLKIILEHEISPNSKTEVTDNDVKEYYNYSNGVSECEIRPNVSQDNLSQSRIDLSFDHSRGRVNIFSDEEESEKEFYEPNPFDREFDFPPPDHYSSDTASEIASLALDTYATKIYDSSMSLQANGNLSHDMSESMTKTEQVNDDLCLGANQLSLVGKINSSLTGVKRNIRKHVQSRQEKLGDWNNSENKITVARWLNMLGKWGKKECNILLSTASLTPEHNVRLVLGREVKEKFSTECRNKSPTFDSFHYVPDAQFKAQTGNIKLCDQGSQGYRPFDTTDVLLESHPHEVVSQHQEVVSQHHEVASQHHEVVSQHQSLGFKFNTDEPIQHQSLGDDYNSVESKQSWELCKMEDSYSLKDTCVKHCAPSSLKDAYVKHGAPSSVKDARVKNGAPSSLKDACVNHGAPSSGWAWFTNVVTKMVSSIKSSEHTRDKDLEFTAGNMTDKEGLQGEANNVEVFPRNYHCDQTYQSEMYKPIMEDYPQEVSVVETNENYGTELASREKSDISFAEYISRHAIDNDWIRKHLDSTKTRTCRSALNNSDDDMATTVQMVVDPRRGVRNPKLKTAYAFIRGRAHYASNASADTEDRSSVMSTPSKSEQSFNESVYTFEGPVNASLKLTNNRIRSVLKQKKNRKKSNRTFYREKISPSKETQNPKRAPDSGKSEQRPPHIVKPIQKTHEKIVTPPRSIRRKTRLDKRDVSAKITRQGSYEVGSSGRHGDASSGETSSGEYSSEIQFKDKPDSDSDGRVIDIRSVFNDDVLSEYFRSQEYNIKPMVTTKATPKIPLYALTLPSVPQHRTSQDAMSARDLVSSPVSGMTRAVSMDVMSVDTMESGDAMLGDDLFQSSLECLLEMLLQRGKVNHAFVASIEGKILAKTSGLMIPADDVMTLICSLTSNYSGSVKLSLMTFTYTCFKDDLNSALIGKAEKSIFVARLGSQNIVVGFTDPCTPGSCIREIQELSTALSQRGL